jgi:alpha-beta hydrolase superfamily lysophospholipase
MKHIDGHFSGVEGISIYYQAWLPETAPKAIIMVAHGIAEHSGRYLNVVNEVIPRGFAVYANDHRGHGRSEGDRCYVDHFDQYIDDVKLFYDLIRKDHPLAPIFLLGHSMGSLIAVQFTAKYESLLSGLILSGSGNKTGGDVSPLLIAISKLLSRIVPRLKIRATDLSQYISHDPEVVQRYRTDPLNFLKGFSARLGAELLRSFAINESLVGSFKLPLLFQAGGEDSLVLNARAVAEKFTMTDKTFRIYEGLWHEVYNESEADRRKVLNDLGEWLDRHAAAIK